MTTTSPGFGPFHSQDIIRMSLYFCDGEDLRCLELVSKFAKSFVHQRSSNPIWFSALRDKIPNDRRQIIKYGSCINYKVLYTLFITKVYRENFSRNSLLRSAEKIYYYFSLHACHVMPRNAALKCTDACCIENEVSLMRRVCSMHARSYFFPRTFNILKDIFGTRCFYNAQGKRVLWCKDCQQYKTRPHGIVIEEVNFTHCRQQPMYPIKHGAY